MASLEALTIAALIELGSVSKEDFDSALQQILRIDAGALHIARVSYWSLRSEPAGIFCELGYQAEPRMYERGAQLPELDCPAYFAEIRKSEHLVVHQVAGDGRLRGLEAYLSARGITSLLDVPVWLRSEVVGVLCHEHTAVKHWTDADVEFALAVSHSLSAALEASSRAGAENSARRNAFLDSASMSLGKSLQQSDVADQSVRLLVPEVADWTVLDVLEGDSLRRLAMAHKDDEQLATLARISRQYPPAIDRPHLSALVVRLGQSILHPALSNAELARYTLDSEHAKLVRSLGTRSAIGVPLIGEGRVFGALCLNSAERTYDQDDLRLAEDFADRVAGAFVNARLYRQAQDAIAARDEFLSLAAHELRTPLTSIKLGLQRFAERSSALSPTDAATLAILNRQASRLHRLIEQLLEASQIGRDSLSLRPERVDLGALVREVTEEFAFALEQAGCELTLDIPGPVVGWWDPVKLAHLLSNLIDNALRFAKGGPLEISVDGTNDEAVLAVQDHGRGIPPETVRRIFDCYSRGNSTQHFGGLGLGLYVVRALADAHDGAVDVDSRPGEGTRVTVKLPRAGPPGSKPSN